MTLEELSEIEAKAAQLCGIVFHLDSPVSAELEEFAIQTRPNILRLCAALREAWADSQQSELWQERGIAEWQCAVETIQAENEQLQARIAELECLLISWHYGPTMQDTSNAFRSLKEIAKDLAAKQEETNDA